MLMLIYVWWTKVHAEVPLGYYDDSVFARRFTNGINHRARNNPQQIHNPPEDPMQILLPEVQDPPSPIPNQLSPMRNPQFPARDQPSPTHVLPQILNPPSPMHDPSFQINNPRSATN